MPEVVVDIRGNADQLRRELESLEQELPQTGTPDVPGRAPVAPPSTTPTAPPQQGAPTPAPSSPATPGRTPDATRPEATAPPPPADSRLIDELRQEVEAQRRGGASLDVALENARSQRLSRTQEDITQRYDARRQDLQRRTSEEYAGIDEEMEAQREEMLGAAGSGANDPLRRQIIDQQIEAERERRYQEAGQRYDTEEEQIGAEENTERAEAQRELTDVLKELTEELRRQEQSGGGTNTDSFLGKLREQRKQILAEREAATDEAGVADANSRLALIDEELRRAMNAGMPAQGRPFYDPALQGAQGIQGLVGGISSGNLGGTIMGGGQAIAALSGMGMRSMLRFMGWAGVAAAAASGLEATSDRSEGLSDLARYRTTPYRDMTDARHYLGAELPSARTQYGTGYAQYGMGQEEFAQQAARRIRGRGMTEDWFEETMGQIGLERSLGLDQDALVKGGQYDRYGQNVTDALSRMVTVLAGIEDSGVSFDDFSRVQEKFDIQQQIMGSYMGRTDRPDYDVANRTLAAFSSVPGITQDARMGSDIQQFQNMIQNPMNDRMQALVYGTVADLFPETGGRMDLIDRALQDPKNEGEIMQAVVQRIVSQFGGIDTQMGYFAFKALLPNIAPDRRDAYIQAFTEGGDAGRVLAGEGYDFGKGGQVDIAAQGNRQKWEQTALGYFTDWTKALKSITENTATVAGKITGTTRSPSPNATLPATK